MKIPVFTGSCTAIITPLTKDNRLDYINLAHQLVFQIENKIQAILVAGTSGEASTLEIHEYEALVDFCVKYASGKIKIIAGIGGNNTAECLKKAEKSALLGADALIMTAPYYNKSTQEGLVAHFTCVANAAPIPLILYNVPSRTSIGISLESYMRLSEHPNINGVKEASGDFSLISKLRARCKDSLHIWSGNDDNTIPIMSLGGLGVISVAANVIPGEISTLCDLCLSGSFSAATEVYTKYSTLFENLFIETNPIPIKKAMEILSLDSGFVRLPLVEMSKPATDKLISSMKACGVLL